MEGRRIVHAGWRVWVVRRHRMARTEQPSPRMAICMSATCRCWALLVLFSLLATTRTVVGQLGLVRPLLQSTEAKEAKS